MRHALLGGWLILMMTGCAPDEFEQAATGDGWRLIGWARGGESVAPALGDDAIRVLGELGLRRMGGATEPTDPVTEIDVVVTHAVSGSCPQVRFDGFAIDARNAVVEAQITDREDVFSLFGDDCSSDANPVVYWLAVERRLLPVGPFELRTDEAPAIVAVIDLTK